MRLIFPESSEDLGVAFNNAIDAGVMQREQPNLPTFFARYELIASDVDGHAVAADWFFSTHTHQYERVPRKEVTE